MKKFECPKCQGDQVLEVMESIATVRKTIVGQEPGGDYVYDGYAVDENDAEIECYECAKCGEEFSREELEEIFG